MIETLEYLLKEWNQLKRIMLFILSLTLILFMVGCNKKEDISAFDLGVEALENEKIEEAKEHFAKVSDEDQDEAELYIELIEAAELIDASLQDDDESLAVETYETIKEEEYFPKVRFIIEEDLNYLDEILVERTKIDDLMNALMTFFDPEDPEMTATELYLLKSDALLESDYLTSEQALLIQEFQEKVKKSTMGTQKDTDSEAQVEESKQETKPEEKPGQEETNNQENQDTSKKEDKTESTKPEESNTESKSSKLTHDEAREVLLKHLYGNAEIVDGSVENGDFRLDYDHDDLEGNYVFQLYEVVQHEGEAGHTATVGWYGVNPTTGKITDKMAN